VLDILLVLASSFYVSCCLLMICLYDAFSSSVQALDTLLVRVLNFSILSVLEFPIRVSLMAQALDTLSVWESVSFLLARALAIASVQVLDILSVLVFSFSLSVRALDTLWAQGLAIVSVLLSVPSIFVFSS